MTEKVKKMKKIFNADWKKILPWCILYTLFGVFCVCPAQEIRPLNATVRLADPEMESTLAQNREELARQSAEIEKLRTENIQKQTENAQRTAEILKLKSEIARLNDENSRLKTDGSKLKSTVSTLDSKLKSSENEGKKLSSDLLAEKKAKAVLEEKLMTKSAENSGLNAVVQRQSSEIREKNSGLKKFEAETTALKAEIMKLREDVSKEKSELEAEKSLLDEKNQSLRKELLDTLERCAMLSERLKRSEQSAAGVLETLNPVYVGQRESELADSLDLVMQCGMKLAGAGTVVCDLILPRLEKLGLGTVEKARIKVALDELAVRNRAFARLSVPPVLPDGFRKCRVLEVRDNEEVIVLNAGFRDGIRVNMTLNAPGETGCRVRVIAVRPFVAAAVIEQGRLRDVSPGMEMLAPGKEDSTKKQKN